MSVTPHFERGTGGVVISRKPPRQRGGSRHRIMVWWREIDRVLLGIVGSLLVCGIIAVAAGSAASAKRLSTAAVQLPDLMFFWQHLTWLMIGLPVMLAVSFLPRSTARRMMILVAAAMLFLLCIVPIAGHEINGARRWLRFGITMQPSEFYMPAFVVLLSWILSWRMRDPSLPVIAITGGVLGVSTALLMLQPNFGSAALLGGVWFVLVLTAGLSPKRIAWAGGALAAAVVAAYFLYENARSRIDEFIGGGEAFGQVDLARKTLLSGGWFGKGLWMGDRKNSLPEAHTDYVLSVVGEEFGLVAIAVIAILFCLLVVRVMWRMTREEDMFTLLAGTGLAALLGGQAFINMAVNLQLFPSKGMTLPLISYGGSSLIAHCISVGLLLSLTRRNPFLGRDSFSFANGLPR